MKRCVFVFLRITIVTVDFLSVHIAVSAVISHGKEMRGEHIKKSCTPNNPCKKIKLAASGSLSVRHIFCNMETEARETGTKVFFPPLIQYLSLTAHSSVVSHSRFGDFSPLITSS